MADSLNSRLLSPPFPDQVSFHRDDEFF